MSLCHRAGRLQPRWGAANTRRDPQRRGAGRQDGWMLVGGTAGGDSQAHPGRPRTPAAPRSRRNSGLCRAMASVPDTHMATPPHSRDQPPTGLQRRNPVGSSPTNTDPEEAMSLTPGREVGQEGDEAPEDTHSTDSPVTLQCSQGPTALGGSQGGHCQVAGQLPWGGGQGCTLGER